MSLGKGCTFAAFSDRTLAAIIMNKLIYINPLDIENINALSSLRNSEPYSRYINSIDYHFVLLSTLYQSGANYFETDIELLPQSIINYPFWKEKLTLFDSKQYDKAIGKVNAILENKLHFENKGGCKR
jgi:hypothetical protein